ncbi:MAG: GWxTD domain-containing protein [Acidobacteriota bacterium]
MCLSVAAKILLIGLFLSSTFPAGEGHASTDDLPSIYKKWLEEDVVYLISPLERQVFKKLASDRERDIFIEAFWKQRDPTPGTPENEFKTEHFRRVNHVNRYFGRQSPLPGWKTDRGRIYIILGEPNDVQKFESAQQTYPAEVWFYQGKTDAGLPPGFNLVFFKEHGSGDYKLYSPTRDGPQALLTAYLGAPDNITAAYRKLKEVEPGLAQVSLSLIPGEESTNFGRPSLSSDILLQKVDSLPKKLVRDAYAHKFLQYKDIVEVEYSANYMDSDSLVKILRVSPSVFCVYYSVEPAKLSVNQYGNKYSTSLSLNGLVKDRTGKIIHQFDKTLAIEFEEEELRRIRQQPYAIRDAFPLIPGSYELSVLLKNEVSKEFTSLEQNLVIPLDESRPWLTPLILGYKAVKVEPGLNRLKPFQVGGSEILAQASRTFLRTDELLLAFQVLGFPQVEKTEAEIVFTFLKESEPFKTFSRRIDNYPEYPNILEPVAMSEFPPAHYQVRVAVRAGDREIAAAQDEFAVTAAAGLPRPWTYSRILPGLGDPLYPFLIGNQLFYAGKYVAARVHLEEAFQKKPDSLDFAFALARAEMALQNYSTPETLLMPFLNAASPPKYEVFLLLASACAKSSGWDRAVKILDQGISHHGLSIGFLNLLGECHLRLGNKAKALQAWEKSLELNPGQPEVERAVKALKEERQPPAIT